jgi:ParB family chromosome partitioning protein
VRGKKKQPPQGEGRKSASVRDLEARLARQLGARVEVQDQGGKGQIAIRYASLDELDRILDQILK